MVIKYLPLRDFWLDSFGTTQIVNVELFCSALDQVCTYTLHTVSVLYCAGTVTVAVW